MRKSDLKSASFRLSEEARRLLSELARRQSVSKTAVLELLIRKAAKDEKID